MNKNFESKVIWAHKIQDLFPKFSTTKMHMSPLRCPQRTRFRSTLNLFERPPRSIWFSTINPHTEEGDTNFLRLNHKIENSRSMPNRLGDKSLRVTNMNEIVVKMNGVLLLKWVAHSRICSNPLSSAQESREKLRNEQEELKIWSWSIFLVVGVASRSDEGVWAYL
jgi:hypothetical protein